MGWVVCTFLKAVHQYADALLALTVSIAKGVPAHGSTQAARRVLCPQLHEISALPLRPGSPSLAQNANVRFATQEAEAKALRGYFCKVVNHIRAQQVERKL